jgi:general secretion pathway protein D
MNLIKPVFILTLLLLNPVQIYALSCENRTFTIQSTKQANPQSILRYLSNECRFTTVFSNRATKDKFNNLQIEFPIQEMSIFQVLDVLLLSNNFSYTLNNHLLQIKGIYTQTFTLDYPLIVRLGNSSTTVTLAGSSSNDTVTSSGAQITTNNKFDFWEIMEDEIHALLNRPEDQFEAPRPLINKHAGLITVSGSNNQIKRVEHYLQSLQERLHKQVLLDISIFNVTLSDQNRTGIDWTNIERFSNFNIELGYNKNIAGNSDGVYKTVSANTDIKSLLGFLNTQGSVDTVSNPKIRTLNNQPALISVGEQLYYKRVSSTIINSDKVTTSNNEIIESTFSGILIDIVPTLTHNNEIILKINPSISSLKDPLSLNKELPPDINKKQLSTVVKLNNQEKIVIGGLISTNFSNKSVSIPLLGDIPLLGTLFSYNERVKETKELVIVITPYI